MRAEGPARTKTRARRARPTVAWIARGERVCLIRHKEPVERNHHGIRREARRRAHNLTQDQLAAKLFVTRQAASRWERGEVTPGIDMMKLITTCECFSMA